MLCSAFWKGLELFNLRNLIEHNEKESAQQKLSLSNIYFSLLLTIENFPLPPSNSFSIFSLSFLCRVLLLFIAVYYLPQVFIFFNIIFVCNVFIPFSWPSMTFRWFSIKQKKFHRAVQQKIQYLNVKKEEIFLKQLSSD